jgi:hypothetical protein
MTHPIFTFVFIISPLKTTWPFIWRNLNSLHPRIIWTISDWFWPAGNEEDFFLNFSVFLLFHYYLPLEKGHPLLLKKKHLSPGGTPLTPKDDLCQVWLKSSQWFLRRSRKCNSLQTERQTNAGWSEKLTRAFSSGYLKSMFNSPFTPYFPSKLCMCHFLRTILINP